MASGAPKPSRQRRSDALPSAYKPQLARLVSVPPTGDEWLHELKYDGYRIGCFRDRGRVRLVSRNGKDWTERFPEVRDAALRLPVERALLDGEVVMLLPDGRSSFQALQNVFAGGSRRRLLYVVFDLLHLDGENVAGRPLEERKRMLAALLKGVERLRFAQHVVGGGAAFFAEACRLGLEGTVAKRRDRPYQAGRSADWLKIKCVRRQEFVIGGYTDPAGARVGIGALLVGTYDARHHLVFAGKVGTGFTQATARDLAARLGRLATRASPFARVPRALERHAHWVRPRLVGEVAFTEWTDDGILRHPSFQGLRFDKPAARVTREPAAAPPSRRAPNRAAATAPPAGAARLTHPERMLYPDDGITKGDVARYYEAVGDAIVPHVRGRPLTLVRCPDGIGSCFFMKHARVWAPPGLRQVRIQEKTKLGEYLVADDLRGVLALVQMDVLEIHTWNTVAEDVERPNRLVLDLDPGPEVTWPAVVAGARFVRELLTTLGLVSFVKTTGGKGLHVVVPLTPDLQWNACLAVARAVAEAIVRHDPRRYTTALPKAGRERKILIDYLRNNRTNTSVAAFSTRARPGAPVSVPLAWDELEPRLRPARFTLHTVPARLRRLRRDPWAAYWTTRQRLPTNARDALARV